MNTATRIIGSIVILLVVFYGGYTAGNSASTQEIETTNVQENEVVHFVIDYGDGEVETFPDVSLTQSRSVFDALQNVVQENIEFTDYGSELGVFIEGINGRQGENNAWWQFWVNGRYSTAGASKTILQPGDTVVFVLTNKNPQE